MESDDHNMTDDILNVCDHAIPSLETKYYIWLQNSSYMIIILSDIYNVSFKIQGGSIFNIATPAVVLLSQNSVHN